MPQRVLDQLIQLRRTNPLKRLLVKHLAMVEHLLDILSRLSRDKRNRHVPQCCEIISQVVRPTLGWHVFGHQVPFVNHQNTWLMIVFDIGD